MDAFNLKARLTLDTSEYDEALDRVRNNVPPVWEGLDGASGKAKKFGATLASAAKVAGAALAAATTAVAKFAKDSVSVGMNFDTAMSQVAATMGKTTDEIADLREFAQEMGATTAFSATQAAEALNYMALAGYDAETSMKMLPNVLNLAAAGGMELATASDMVTDAQSALGLSLEETSEMVDKMAMASSKSNTSVSQLGEAFLTIGATAKQLSGGTTELATALGILADNGVKGAEGGTALRNVLNSLSSDKFKNSFGKLGVSAYDANGEMRSLKDTLADMNAVMANMTTQEKTDLINKAFNAYDLAKVNALLDTSVERWDELSGSIDNAAESAQKMADTQLDNLAGNITLAKSAFEGLQIAISEKLTPTLTEFVKYGANALSEMTKSYKADGLDGLMDTVSEQLDTGISMITDKIPVFVDAGSKLLGAVADGILNNLPTIMENGNKITVSLLQKLTEAIPEVAQKGSDIIVSFANGLADNIPILYSTAASAVDGFVQSISNPDNLKSILNAGAGVITSLATGIADAVPKLAESAVDLILNLADFILDPENIVTIVKTAGEVVAKLAGGIISAIPKLAEGAVKLVGGFIEAIFTTDWIQVGGEIVSGIVDGIANAGQQIWDAGLELGKNLYNAVHGNTDENAAAIEREMKKLADGYFSYYDEILGETDNALREFAAKYQNVVNDVGDGFTLNFSEQEDAEYVIEVLEDLQETIKSTGKESDTLNTMYYSIARSSANLKGAVANINEYIAAQNRLAETENRLASYGQAKFIPTEALRQQRGEEAKPLISQDYASSSGWVDRSASYIKDAGKQASAVITETGKQVSSLINDTATTSANTVSAATKATADTAKKAFSFATKAIGEYRDLGIDKFATLGKVLTTEQEEMQKTAKTVWDASKDWAENEIKANALNLEEQVDIWTNVRDQFVKNSEEWLSANDKVISAQQNLADENEKTAESIVQANEKIYDNLESEVNKLVESYASALEKEKETVFNQYSLFDEVPERIQKSGEQLTKNLEAQNNNIKKFYSDVEKLSERGVSSELAESIREMGVKATDELDALLDMTDEQLKEYDRLFKERESLSADIAKENLKPLEESTQEQISALTAEAIEGITENGKEIGLALSTGMAESMSTGAAEMVEKVKNAANDAWKEAFGTEMTSVGTIAPELTTNATVNNDNKFTFNINGIQYQTVTQLAKAVANELQFLTNRRKAGYAGT